MEKRFKYIGAALLSVFAGVTGYFVNEFRQIDTLWEKDINQQLEEIRKARQEDADSQKMIQEKLEKAIADQKLRNSLSKQGKVMEKITAQYAISNDPSVKKELDEAIESIKVNGRKEVAQARARFNNFKASGKTATGNQSVIETTTPR